MKLANATLRPGNVVEVLENGEIKAIAPGLFNIEDPVENLPPIHPFFSNHANAYTMPLLYDEVWIMNFTDNPLQLYWIRKDNFKENNYQLMQEENVEILCNRETGLGWATIYFSDGSGWVIRKDGSQIQIREDGTIVLKTDTPHRTIDINSKGISLGDEGQSPHPAAYGDKTQEALEKILATFQAISIAATANPYTIPIGTIITKKLPELQTLVSNVTSPHVTLA